MLVASQHLARVLVNLRHEQAFGASQMFDVCPAEVIAAHEDGQEDPGHGRIAADGAEHALPGSELPGAQARLAAVLGAYLATRQRPCVALAPTRPDPGTPAPIKADGQGAMEKAAIGAVVARARAAPARYDRATAWDRGVAVLPHRGHSYLGNC
jgi:hypothetical protein